MTFDPGSVSAVIFDIGGIFLYPHYESVRTALGEEGEAGEDDFARFRRAHHGGCFALSRLGADAREHHGDFWTHYDQGYADALEVPVESVQQAIRTSWDWAHEENIAAFHRLAASGMPVAIVSNNNGTAPEQMRNYGVCQVLPGGPLPKVAAIIDSSLVGVAKPDPMIMAPALYALDVDPANALYIGDTVHADVVGAANAGMQMVQLDPFDQHASFEHSRLPDISALVEALR